MISSDAELESSHDLFGDGYDEPGSSLLGSIVYRKRIRDYSSLLSWGGLAVVLAAYSFLVFIAGYYIGTIKDSDRPSSPVDEAIEIETRTVNTQFPVENAYKGPPSVELDDAWVALTKNLHVRISSEDLRRMNETSIALSDAAGGYLAALDVVHQIHCLNYIRQRAYKEHYEELPMAEMHLDHCIDSIRQTLMCLPNDSLIMYDWSPNLMGPAPRFISQRQCVDWSGINSWAVAHRVDLFDTDAVVHPLYGPSFPDGPEETFEKYKHGGFRVQPQNDTASP
ncbi:hypothetical protein F5Y04DRAFT_276774 [Hypomontagnella monticulosa]|nr:hypothetical protein F5Y04DRAFT_276774 [Hypomontagnella monticulosa]